MKPALFTLLLLILNFPATAKEWVDLIISGQYVVTMDDERLVIPDGALAIKGDTIIAVGYREDIREHFSARRFLGGDDSIVMPGLINTHTHIPMTLLRGIADDKTLMDWLNNYIWPIEKELVSEEMVKWGTLLGCWEMIRTGTTTFVDSYFFEDVIAETTKKAGMRAICGHGTSDFESAHRFFQKWNDDPLITPAIAPHSVYTCSKEDLRNAKEIADKYDGLFMMHAAESKGEMKHSHQKFNLSPIRLLEELDILSNKVLLAHTIWIDDAEVALLKKHNVGIAHCPESNMTLASGVAKISSMIRSGIVEIGLGTDGAASNQTLDMFEEMNLAAKLQKVNSLDPTLIPAKVALEMATINGAKAISMDDQIGSLEKGKKADVTLIKLDYPSLVPFYDPYSLIVYACRGNNVNDVVVNGKILMKDRHFKTINTGEVLEKAKEFKEKIKDKR